MGEREAVFLGRVTAGFTHELKNVLAIIKESTGLMEDLLSMTPEGSFPHRERFNRALSTVLEQVGRGVELSTRLNRLAHTPDVALGSVELDEACRQMVLLCERFARLKGVTLKALPPVEGQSTAVTSPLQFHLAMFYALEALWSQLTQGGEVTLQVKTSGNEVLVEMTCSGTEEGSEMFAGRVTTCEPWCLSGAVMEILGGRLICGPAQYGFTLALPVESSA